MGSSLAARFNSCGVEEGALEAPSLSHQEQAMRRDIDEAIKGWPYKPEPGEVLAREVQARDGRTVLQIRVELGLIQLEVSERPDGARPHGFATYLDYLRYRANGRVNAASGTAPTPTPWRMPQAQSNDT